MDLGEMTCDYHWGGLLMMTTRDELKREMGIFHDARFSRNDASYLGNEQTFSLNCWIPRNYPKVWELKCSNSGE
jgi:hypothetical protein